MRKEEEKRAAGAESWEDSYGDDIEEDEKREREMRREDEGKEAIRAEKEGEEKLENEREEDLKKEKVQYSCP